MKPSLKEGSDYASLQSGCHQSEWIHYYILCVYSYICQRTCVCLLAHLISIPPVFLEHTTIIKMKFASICGKAVLASSVALAAAEVTPRFVPDTSGIQYDETVRCPYYLGTDPKGMLNPAPCKGGSVTIPVEPLRLSDSVLRDRQLILVIIVHFRQ